MSINKKISHKKEFSKSLPAHKKILENQELRIGDLHELSEKDNVRITGNAPKRKSKASN